MRSGLSFSDFREIIRTGIDDDAAPPNVPSATHDLLQVMPWPILRNMTDGDLRAIYEYLSAIPCIATAAGPGGEPPALHVLRNLLQPVAFDGFR